MQAKKKQGRGPRKAPHACGPDVWDVVSWCAQFGIGESTFYRLKHKPELVRFSRNRVRVIESPSAYSRRIAALQQEQQQAVAA